MYCQMYLFLVAGSPVNPGSLEVKLSVNLDGGAKDISHDHPVGFSIVHGQPVHPQVLRQQGLPLSSNRMLGEKKIMDEFLPSQWCLDGSSQQQLFWRFSSTSKNLFTNVLTKFSHRHWGEFSNFKLETKTVTKELAKPMYCMFQLLLLFPGLPHLLVHLIKLKARKVWEDG